MFHRTRTRQAVTITALMLALATTSPAAETTDVPDLSGLWVLDEAASDDVAAVLKSAVSGAEGRGGGMSGRGGGMGGRGGGMGGRGGGMGGRGGGTQPQSGEDQGAGSRQDAMAKELRNGAERLEIFLEAEELNLTDGNGLTQLLAVGGETSVWTSRGERLAAAAWDGNVLRVTYHAKRREGGDDGGGRTPPSNTVLYERDGDLLIVTRLFQPPRQEEPLRIRFVYGRTVD